MPNVADATHLQFLAMHALRTIVEGYREQRLLTAALPPGVSGNVTRSVQGEVARHAARDEVLSVVGAMGLAMRADLIRLQVYDFAEIPTTIGAAPPPYAFASVRDDRTGISLRIMRMRREDSHLDRLEIDVCGLTHAQPAGPRARVEVPRPAEASTTAISEPLIPNPACAGCPRWPSHTCTCANPWIPRQGQGLQVSRIVVVGKSVRVVELPE